MLTSGRFLAKLDHLAQAHAGGREAGIVADGVHQALALFPRHVGGSGFANWTSRVVLWSYGVQHGSREGLRWCLVVLTWGGQRRGLFSLERVGVESGQGPAAAGSLSAKPRLASRAPSMTQRTE